MQNFKKQVSKRFLILTIALTICISIMTACNSSTDTNNHSNEKAAGSEQNKTAVVENKPTETPKAVPTKVSNGLPDLKNGEDYKSSVRVKMLKAGWKPAPPTEDYEKCGSGDSRCDEYPELESCAGTGMGNCKFRWQREDKIVAIFTVDDPYIYTEYEFEKTSKPASTTNIIGTYIYWSKHEYGTDRFIYELKENNVAVYSSEQEGGEEDGKRGAWAWEEAKKTITVTLSPDESQPQVYIFKSDGKNLEMLKEPKLEPGFSGFIGKIFKKQ